MEHWIHKGNSLSTSVFLDYTDWTGIINIYFIPVAQCIFMGLGICISYAPLKQTTSTAYLNRAKNQWQHLGL